MMIGILILLLLLIPTQSKAEIRDYLFDESAFDVAHMGHSFPTDQWIEKLRDHESRKDRTPIDEMIDDSLIDYSDQTIDEE